MTDKPATWGSIAEALAFGVRDERAIRLSWDR
jgi:hypothetical protein